MNKIIVLNNKNTLKKNEFIEYLNILKDIKPNNTLILCPSSCYLSISNLDNIHLGSQDISIYNDEVLTGEITAQQLKSLGVEYSITGHLERRVHLKEKSKDINKKLINSLNNNIIPILCVGETDKQIDINISKEYILNMLQEELINIDKNLLEKIIISYEPFWSIGKDSIIDTGYIDEILKSIKEIYPNNKLLYGGSVNEDNIFLLNKSSFFDGYILGRLSTNINKLNGFLERLEED